jgi:phosphopantetheinyl transferase (holo-ACP synthase)
METNFETEIMELIKDRIQKEIFRAHDLRTKMVEENEIKIQECNSILLNHIKHGQTIINMTDFEIVSKFVEQIPITTLRNDFLAEEALSKSYRSKIDDDMSIRTIRGTRSNIERNNDKTFENCKTIIITEKYNGTEVSISLKRKHFES